PPLELPYDRAKDLIRLHPPREIRVSPIDLREAIERRESLREYKDAPLSLSEVSFLLWCTQGVRQVMGRQFTFRTVPSAGARHAFETYLLANRVSDLEPGLYRYLALEHCLIELDTAADCAERVTAACLNQLFVKRSAVTFLWTAVAGRMTWRYGSRGYRYLHLDAGHVCQNLCLAAEAVDCGACPVGAFDDDAVNAVLGIDGTEQFVIYIAALGKKR
ncbi:MAG: SagB/ThcOx family dehydrogenase, partial [Methanomicrobiaceae archaeon]|nr:SagB/ThcOx family dehydrogenase [Methanomicrobiaceae archaeon]